MKRKEKEERMRIWKKRTNRDGRGKKGRQMNRRKMRRRRTTSQENQRRKTININSER